MLYGRRDPRGAGRDIGTGRVWSAIRARRLSYDPNDLALLFVVALPFILYLYSTSERKAKIVLVGLGMLCLYGVVLTRSRGGMLALMVVGALVLSRSRLSRNAKLTTVAAAVIVFGILAGTAWKERIATIWDPQTEYDRTAGGRTEIWQTGLMLLLTRPWGAGMDGFVMAEGNYHGGGGKWNTAHNSFLQIASGARGRRSAGLHSNAGRDNEVDAADRVDREAGDGDEPGQRVKPPLWRQLKKRTRGPDDDRGPFQLSEALELSCGGSWSAGSFFRRPTAACCTSCWPWAWCAYVSCKTYRVGQEWKHSGGGVCSPSARVHPGDGRPADDRKETVVVCTACRWVQAVRFRWYRHQLAPE